MKLNKMFSIVLVAMLFFLAGCESSTELGDCVGIQDPQKPDLNYQVSVRNAIVSVIFVETLVVPIVTLVSETYCPYSKK